MRGSHALALPLALLFGLLPANAPGQTPPPRWLGIQLGQPASELRSLLGDPVLVTRFPLDQSPAAPQRPERKARYTLSMQEPLYALVSERHGVIVGIEAFSPRPLTAEQVSVVPDPSGVRLGATEADVRRVHPDLRRTAVSAQETFYSPIGDSYVATYLMDGGRVSAIIWFTLPEKDLSADDGPPLSEPAGDSPETAILDVQKNETDGVRWELIWQRFHPCDATTQWTKSRVATSQQNGRSYDAVTLTCPTTGATRTVYFDITPFFGKF